MGNYVRVVYDDRRKFPWVVVYAGGDVWASFRSREAALQAVDKLMDVVLKYA